MNAPTPSFAPNARPWRGPLTVAGVLILAYSLVLPGIPPARFQLALALPISLLNLLALALYRWRAREYPDERKGWAIFAIAIPFILLSNAVLTLAGPLQAYPGTLDWVYLALSLFIGILQAMALLAWPWRDSEKELTLVHFLGSLLFGSSVFLLLWVIGLWQAAFQGHAIIHARVLALAGRLAITSGAAVYLFGQDPRRVRGPLGWILAAMIMLSIAIGLFQPLIQSGGITDRISPWFGLILLAPVFLCMAAWSRHPVEVPQDQPDLRIPFTEALLYVPFLFAGGVLGLAILQSKGVLTWPLLTFLAITGILLLRQFLLLREVKAARTRLEERVAQRTQALERMQSVMLKTERMNALATLGAGLAHDLNNLLGVIRNSAELMQMELEEGQVPSNQDLQRIMDASGKAGNLTHRLMAFARNEPSLQPTDHREIAEALVPLRELLLMLLPRSIRLDFPLDAPATRVFVDPAILEQVLVNLVSNAKDAMPDGGQVTIRLYPGSMPGTNSAAVLEISDNGPGIPEELQEVIFDAFFTTKPEGKGTGLGLASVRTMMEAQEGRVELESAPGQGTTFRLFFPEKPITLR